MEKRLLTQERLKELLSYDESSGLFYWKVSRRNIKAGDIAGHLTEYGYYKLMIDSVVYQAHQLAWFYHYGYFPKGQIDHINHNKSDNRICNLREVSEKDNHKNRPKQVNNTSGCTGVSWYKLTNKWIAHIQVNKKHITLGYFNTFTEAVRARKEAEVKYGFYKNHGRGVL